MLSRGRRERRTGSQEVDEIVHLPVSGDLEAKDWASISIYDIKYRMRQESQGKEF